ncbi:hypothetical protein A2U01_0024698 [Trifolium medium]|uniref:Uncharacterized protein n=1 Tax=Trifolium medium TaxID=97028 RepID=A0A392NV10_9FABA|nr:hypothetical protein [Trifolium medium]
MQEMVTAAGKERGFTNWKRRWCVRERLSTTGVGIYILKMRFGLKRKRVGRRI